MATIPRGGSVQVVEEQAVVRILLRPQPEPRPDHSVRWDGAVIDNENLNKKKSKSEGTVQIIENDLLICCLNPSWLS